MNCAHPITLKTGDVVPCGKCPACRANERQEWVFRLKQEYKVSSFSLFVTLTYDDEHLPDGQNVCKKDVQLFLKRFRKHLNKGELRYYIVSEYGDHTFRPHYHGLFFFQQVLDKIKIYDLITESWQNGFVSFGDVEEGSIVYCTKYCLKRSAIPSGRVPVFRLMSKMNGGLGFNYIDDMGVYHVDTGSYNVAFANGTRCRMPKYYKDLLKRNNPVYNQQKELSLNAYRDKQLLDNERRFEAFKRKYVNDLDACNAFNAHQRAVLERRDDLIMKHCKKQKF